MLLLSVLKGTRAAACGEVVVASAAGATTRASFYDDGSSAGGGRAASGSVTSDLSGGDALAVSMGEVTVVVCGGLTGTRCSATSASQACPRGQSARRL